LAIGKVLAVVSYPVKDFAAWKVVYDSIQHIRESAGVTGDEVFQDHADPTKIVVIHRFHSVEAAQNYLAHADVQAARIRSGITAPHLVTLAIAS